MSLLHPPIGFPPHLAVFWPLIWVQLLLLRAAVRNAYGTDVQYHWSVSPNGRVFLTSIDWVPSQKADRDWLAPSPYFNDRLAAACDVRSLEPAYARFIARSGRSATPASQRVTCAQAHAGKLPLPET